MSFTPLKLHFFLIIIDNLQKQFGYIVNTINLKILVIWIENIMTEFRPLTKTVLFGESSDYQKGQPIAYTACMFANSWEGKCHFLPSLWESKLIHF